MKSVAIGIGFFDHSEGGEESIEDTELALRNLDVTQLEKVEDTLIGKAHSCLDEVKLDILRLRGLGISSDDV